MLRPFTLVSDPLVYTGGIAPVNFPHKPRCRSAIVRVGYRASSPRIAHRNVVHDFKVVGRNYIQGDPIPFGLIAPAPLPLADDLSGGTPSDALAALTNTGALDVTALDGAANTTLTKRVIQDGVHTWAGGAALTDTVAVVGIDATDIIHATTIADDGNAAVVHAVAGVDLFTITLSENGANDTTKIAYTVIRPSVLEHANEKDIAAQLTIQRTFNSAVMNALASLAAQGSHREGYFPGSLLTLRDGRRIGGIKIKEGQNVSMRIEDLTAGSAEIERVILHCVEFPSTGQGARMGNALWREFDAGMGEIMFYGHAHDYDAAFDTRFEAQPHPADADGPLRRLAVRGALYDGSHNLIESEMNDLLAEVFSASQKPPHDQPVPAREIIGHAGYHSELALTDLYKHEKAIVRVVAGSAPAAARTLRLASIFEGRNEADEFTGTAEQL